MKRQVVSYARTRLGEVMRVKSHSWVQRALGRTGHSQTFYRPHRNAFWYSTPGPSSRSVVSPRFARQLDDLRDAWEHDHTDWDLLAEQRLGQTPRDHVVLAHLDECDCGRAHPTGYVCVSAWRDSL